MFLCFSDRASRFIYVTQTNLMHYLSSVYFFIQPLHVSGIFVAYHQEVYCIYTARTKLLYIYSIPPDDGLQICPKHVELDWRNKLRIISASIWFYYVVLKCIELLQMQYTECCWYLLITRSNDLCKHFNIINFIVFVTLAYTRKDPLKMT